jgi:hypothetical protein
MPRSIRLHEVLPSKSINLLNCLEIRHIGKGMVPVASFIWLSMENAYPVQYGQPEPLAALHDDNSFSA